MVSAPHQSAMSAPGQSNILTLSTTAYTHSKHCHTHANTHPHTNNEKSCSAPHQTKVSAPDQRTTYIENVWMRSETICSAQAVPHSHPNQYTPTLTTDNVSLPPSRGKCLPPTRVHCLLLTRAILYFDSTKPTVYSHRKHFSVE
jgi:hypothetical protein